MKYLAIPNDSKIEMIRDFFNQNDIQFFEYSNPEERMLTEIVCDSLDNVLAEHGLSSDDLSIKLEDSIIDRATSLLSSSQHTFKELEDYSLEVVKETFEEKVDLNVLNDWSEEANLSKSILLYICDRIREFYKKPNFNIKECFKIFQEQCSLWDSPEEFCEYMSSDMDCTVEMVKEFNNFFELENGEYLACM